MQNCPNDRQGTTYEHFFYNSAWQVLETRSSSSENTGPESLRPQYQYVWSPRHIDAPVLRDENTDFDGLCDDARIYYLDDANFNVTTLVDTVGDALERYLYSPYGVLTIYDATWSNIRSDSSYAAEYTYTGRRLDRETGLFYYRHRIYAAQLGRFVQRDPIRSVNLYCHVRNSPIVRVDPFGLVPVTVTFPDGTVCTGDCDQPKDDDGNPAEPCRERDLKPSCDDKCQAAVADAQDDPGVLRLIDQIKAIPGCEVPAFKCADCGTGKCKAGAWHMGETIYVCDGQGPFAVQHLKHELTHHIQRCRKQVDVSCYDRMIMEMEANLAGGLDFQEAFSAAIWSSCITERCSPGQINDGLAVLIWTHFNGWWGE